VTLLGKTPELSELSTPLHPCGRCHVLHSFERKTLRRKSWGHQFFNITLQVIPPNSIYTYWNQLHRQIIFLQLSSIFSRSPSASGSPCLATELHRIVIRQLFGHLGSLNPTGSTCWITVGHSSFSQWLWQFSWEELKTYIIIRYHTLSSKTISWIHDESCKIFPSFCFYHLAVSKNSEL